MNAKAAIAAVAGLVLVAGAPTAAAQSTGSLGGEVIGTYTTTEEQGDTTYHVIPTDAGRTMGSAALAGYDPIPEMVDKGIGNRANIAGQLICHIVFAPTKAVWNLEGFRPHVSISEYFQSQCNPPAK